MSDLDPMRVVVDPEAIGWLASGADIVPNSLSPLGIATGEPSPDAFTDQLRQLGLADAGGTLSTNLRSALRVLATSHLAVRIRLAALGRVLHFQVYVDPDGGPPVSLGSAPGGLQIERPAAPGGMLEAITDALGASPLLGCEFEANLAPLESLVLAVLLDAQRIANLRWFGDSADPPPQALDAATVRYRIETSRGSGDWLTGELRRLCGPSVETSPAAVDQALRNLEMAGHASRNGHGYGLGSSALLLAYRLLLPEAELEAAVIAESQQGQIIGSGFTCLQSGVHDFLLLELTGNKVGLETVTAATVVEYLRAMLARPEAFASDVEP